MKRLIALLLIATALFSLSSCGSKNTSVSEPDIDESVAAEEEIAEEYIPENLVSDEEADQLISDALSQELPEATAVMQLVYEEEDIRAGDAQNAILGTDVFNFTLTTEQFYTRFAYYVAKFGQSDYRDVTASLLKAIATNDEDCLYYDDGYTDLSLYTDVFHDYLKRVSPTCDWDGDSAKAFVYNVIFPAIFAALGEPEADAIEDMSHDHIKGMNYYSSDALYSFYVDVWDDDYIRLVFTPCTTDTLLENGYSVDDIFDLVNYKIVDLHARPTYGAYFSEDDATAIYEGTVSSEYVTGVFVNGNELLVQFATDDDMVVTMGTYGIDAISGIYVASALATDDGETVFDDGLQFTFEDDVIRFVNLDDVLVGGFTLPEEIYGDLPLAMSFE